MRRPERLTALRLAPLRSLRALTDPRHAALRTVRLVSAVFHGAAVRCSLPTLGCEVGWGRAAGDAVRWRRAPLRYGDASFGLLQVCCSRLLWRRRSHLVSLLAEPLALLLALHAESPRNLRGTVLAPQPLHELNNAVHALNLQISVMQTLLDRGDTEEARQFSGLCVRQSDKLVALVIRLRSR